MGILDEYEKTKKDISAVNESIWPVLKGLAPAVRKPVDRVNDLALVLLSIFAFESLCWDCIHEVARRHAPVSFGTKLMCALRKAAAKCDAAHKLKPIEAELRQIMQIRNLYAHGVGRRARLEVPSSLLPKVLREYGFMADSCDGCTACGDCCQKTDESTQWWPTPSRCGHAGAFSLIGDFFRKAQCVVLDALGCRNV